MLSLWTRQLWRENNDLTIFGFLTSFPKEVYLNGSYDESVPEMCRQNESGLRVRS